ncbi:MAG: hypothetical protein HC837_21330 [Chloroflexaceae bacterium]|nr:hypothetical protein [Chloroflexaceae bacterium]
MPYSTLRIQDLQTHFGLTINQTANLFAHVPKTAISDLLRKLLDDYIPLASAIGTEKARSEFLIAPILAEVRRRTNYQVSLFSGVELTIDPDRGLHGVCDFVLSRSPGQFFLTAPIVMMVEAKNENIKGGIVQCIGEMIAARCFNEREGNEQTTIYGAVTTGTIWRFLQLTEQTAFIDQPEYYIDQVDTILAILLEMVR